MTKEKKTIAILGATGSIGRQTLEVVRAHPDRFIIKALTAGYNVALLAEQAREFHPEYVSCQNPEGIELPGNYRRATPEEIATLPGVDIVVVASAGITGLVPTMAAARTGKTIALANKETLVMAGELITAAVSAGCGTLVPLDSEHSAIWQCLQGEETFPSRLILTASGGPFLHGTSEKLEKVTPAEALAHPSWRMGRKITIDSATLVNKGMEVIEAHYLFDTPLENIDVVVHPECLIHSLVEFPDGTLKAQLGRPDMRLPIQFALAYPERLASPDFPRLDFKAIRKLTFEEPDYGVFPGLKIALAAGEKGGTYPAVLVGADETAVSLFLRGKIRFVDIPRMIEDVLARHTPTASPSLEEIVFAENWARSKALQWSGGK
jgi:1-deoxy-D-xylulose-5-phosphate reductoisomerase